MPNVPDPLESHIVCIGDRHYVQTPDGKFFEMHDYGGGPSLDLDPRIDLCKPIYDQARKLGIADGWWRDKD